MEDIGIYKEIMENMPGGFFVYHADGDEELIDINEPALRIFGCDTVEEFKELTGFTFKGLVHPDDIDMAEKSIAEQIKNNEYAMDYIEYRIIRKDGSIRWIEDYGHFAHTDRYGDVFYVFIEDATERRNERTAKLEDMNKKLRRAYSVETQYKRAMLSDVISYFEVNLTKDLVTSSVIQVIDGKQQDLFKYINEKPKEKFSELVDFVKEHRRLADDETYFKFLDPDRLIRCYEKGDWEQIYETWVIDHKDRKKLYRYTFLLGRDEESEDIVGLFLTKDLTNVAEGQTLINLANDQANAANAARDVYLGNMSHDLRNPLNGIIGFTRVIREVQDNKVLLNKYLDKIELLSAQILNTVDGSLEYSKLESGNSILHETEGTVLSLVEEIKEMTVPITNSKDMKLVVDTDGVTSKKILVDMIRMKRVLYELLDNAVKFTDTGGEVSFVVKELDDAPKGYAKYNFCIKDSGIGMDEELMKRMYKPFERGYDMMEGGVIGSGLGLAVVKGLIDLMEGCIEVDSREGEGTTFNVIILFKLA